MHNCAGSDRPFGRIKLHAVAIAALYHVLQLAWPDTYPVQKWHLPFNSWLLPPR